MALNLDINIAFVLVICVMKSYYCIACEDCCLNCSWIECDLTIQNETGLVDYKDNTMMTGNCDNRTWLYSEDCECGNSLDGVVYCDSTKQVFLFSQFCMAYDERVGEEVVGRCPYTYLLFSDPNVSNVGLYVKLPPIVDKLETFMCDRLNKKGFFCGKCEEGYGYSMYPDFLKCVECDPKDHVRNWLLYLIISYVPLTVFLILVVCLRISVTSAPMNVFIFISQIITHPPFLRGFSHTIDTTFLSHGARMFIKFLLSLYSLWNLNFFTTLIPHFCLPNQNVSNVISLTFLVALYPLLLLFLIYVLIELHSRNFKVIVWLWKPFIVCYARFRRKWDIRASIIDAFATFLLLSFVKFLFVSIDLAVPTKLMAKNGTKVGYASYNDASIVSDQPIAILTLIGISIILLLFVVVPSILLLLYPCHFCQKCLTFTRLNFQALCFLMDSFHGCYKNGTEGTRDCRYFASLFLITRIAIGIAYATSTMSYLAIISGICISLAIAIAVVHPYNKQNDIFNHLDPLTLFFLIIWLLIFQQTYKVTDKNISFQHWALPFCYISLILPILVVSTYWFNKLYRVKLKQFVSRFRKYRHLDEDLPEQRSHTPYVSSNSLHSL